MKIGEDVLFKIEKLITQIDKPASPKKIRPQRTQMREYLPHDKQIYNKLYEDHKLKQSKHAAKVQQKKDEQDRSCSPFKVTNKHTIFLNTQQSHRPLHQRIEQLQNRKIENLLLLRQKYPVKQPNEDVQQQQAIREMEQRRRNERKYTQRQVNAKIQQLHKKQRARIQKMNRLKIQLIQEHSKDFRCKPYVGKETEALWNRYKLKKQLSTSVFERFQQYQMDRKMHLQQKQKQIRSRVTPFTPKISQNSRIIASRSTSRLQVKQNKLSRSISCKCLQRGKKHNKSTAMHTSRKI